MCNEALATVYLCSSTACFPTVKLEATDPSETPVLIDETRRHHVPQEKRNTKTNIKKYCVLPAVFMSLVWISELKSILSLYSTSFLQRRRNVFTARYELNIIQTFSLNLTRDARVRSQFSSSEICSGRWGKGQVSLPVLRLSSIIIIPTMTHSDRRLHVALTR